METDKYAWKAEMLAQRGRLERAIETAKEGLTKAELEFSNDDGASWEPLLNLVEIKTCLGGLLIAQGEYTRAMSYLAAVLAAVIPEDFPTDLFDPTLERARELVAECERHVP